MKVLVLEPQFVARRTIVLSASRLGLAALDEAASLGVAERLLRGASYRTVVLALDAGPLADVERLLAVCAPAQVIGIATPGQPAPEAGWAQHGVQTVLDRPARVKDLLTLISLQTEAVQPVTA